MEQRGRSRKKPQMRPVLEAERDRRKAARKTRGPMCGRKRKRSKVRSIKMIVGFVLLLTIGYMAVGLHYKDSFLPNTVIGGMEVGGMTVEEIQSCMREGVERYQLVIRERDGREEVIEGKDIGLQPLYDGSLERILRGQNPFLWGMKWMTGEAYEQNCTIMYDRERLEALVSGLECLNPEKMTEPANASLVWQKDKGLVIVPEKRGNEPVYERLLEAIETAVAGLKPGISLEELGIYREPEIRADDPALLNQKEQWEQYTSANVTYRFGSRSEVVDGSIIAGWLTADENGETVIDRIKVEEYVKGLAKKYNTAYRARELKTSYGPTVKITKGHYGWIIDQKAEAEKLIEMIDAGQSGEREPVYLQTANSHDGPDYGDTYVEMNLTAQHLFYYKKGELLVESDFVSGDEAKGWSTPEGSYELTYKQKDAILKGSNYRTPVTYWMPFNGNIGMHDGYWRSSFGGTIYKKNGSHGCVNLPPAVAKTIFENIEKGTPVLCYHLDGTETNRTTRDASAKDAGHVGKEQESAPAISPPAETAAEAAETEGTAPEETVPAKPDLEETIPAGPAQTESAPAPEAGAAEPGVRTEAPTEPAPSD